MSLVLLERPEDYIALLRMNRPDAMRLAAVRDALQRCRARVLYLY